MKTLHDETLVSAIWATSNKDETKLYYAFT